MAAPLFCRMTLRLSDLRTYSVGSPGKRKRDRGAFNSGAVILSDDATLIRPTVRYAGSSPGKRKRNRGAFNGRAVILSDGATLIRPTVRYSLVAPVSASATGERSMAAPLFCRMALRLSDLSNTAVVSVVTE